MQLDLCGMEVSVLYTPAGFSDAIYRNRRLDSIQHAKEEPLYSRNAPQFATSRKLPLTNQELC